MTLDRLVWPAMKAKNLTATELAAQLGVSRNFLYRMVKGEKAPPPEKVEALSRILGIDTDDIYAAAGIIPPDIRRDVVANVFTIRAAREAIGRVLGRKKR